MAAVIQIQDIDDVLANLNYANPNTQKYKLVQAIRHFYLSEDSSDFPNEIDAVELVKILWDTGEDAALIKSKKKNLSSTKSAVNADLKKLYQEGGNPNGIIIGRNNIFDLSDEAKNKALTQLAESLKGAKEGVIGKIAEVLETINQHLSNPETLSEQGSDDGLKKLDVMKQLVLDLGRKIGLSAGDIAGTGPYTGTGSIFMDSGVGDAGDRQVGADDAPGKGSLETVEKEDGAPADAIDVVEAVDEYEEILADDTGEAYEQEKARDAAWQDLGLEETAESDLPLEEAPPESEDILVEALAEESLETFDEIVEDVVGEELRDELQEITEVAAGDGLEGESEALEEAGVHIGAEEGVTADLSLEEAPTTTGDALADAAMGEPLEAVDEIVEEVAEAEILDQPQGLDGDFQDKAETLAEPGPDSMLEEVLEEGLPDTEDATAETTADGSLEGADEIVEETADEELPDESEELLEEVAGEDLQDKAEVLASLAEAAKILEKLGPDFNDSIYSEEEIKEKAKSLSEEFDRHLAIRDKFFNQHILIKSGTYTIGGKEPKDHEKPEQAIQLQAFYIGKFPVTNALFELFVENTGYKTTAERCGYGLVYSSRGRKEKDPRTGRERFIWRNSQEYRRVEGACWYCPSGPGSSIHDKKRHPVVQVSLEDARAFAAWTGKRIPTEGQWEAAARTRLGHLYPWGNDWKEKACNVEKTYTGDTTPVDQYLASCNGSGLADTLGNVLEWTLDAWTNPATGEKDLQYYITKGGSWASNGSLSLYSRFRIAKSTTSNILGFRSVAI